METKAKRRRHIRSETPPRVVITERDRKLFELLDPRYHFKYLTTSWIAVFLGADNPWKLDALKRRLRDLFDAGYLNRPHQQRNSPNANYKDAVYERTDEGARQAKTRPGARGRSNSYAHEILTDLGYRAPMELAARIKGWKLYTAKDLLDGASFSVRTKQGVQVVQFPERVRHSKTPFIADSDYAPLLLETDRDLVFFPIFQGDRKTESLENLDPTDPNRTTLTEHIDEIIDFHKKKLFYSHYGMASALYCIITTNETHMRNAMNYVMRTSGDCKFLLFKTLPDIAFEEHFPKPSADFFLSPWKRVGHPDFEF